ncbi:MAG TPA: protein kinase [Pirellulales bacterium]|jgi:Leucine-rich repeat (LRR) protein|nr:protein kinase [Pirellulales bacterium]
MPESTSEEQRHQAQATADMTAPQSRSLADEPTDGHSPSIAPTLAGGALPGQIHTWAQFADCLSMSGLMSSEEFHAFDASLTTEERPTDAHGLAELLVKRKRLTEYQANLLRLGQTKGLVFGNYVIVDKLGEGGMGVVFKANHRRMKRTVALKVLPADLTNSADAIARFHREVEAAAKLTHPNIAAAYDADEAGGVHFLVMEYVDGLNLSQLVKQSGPLPLGAALNYVLQAARGLSHAHARGVVHRDIKPGNLLVDSTGVVKILDMGLARFENKEEDGAAQAELTQSGRVMGTVDYMAPEQALDAKHADQRADIYSIGCTLYYLLTGRALSPDGTLTQKLIWHQTEAVPALSAVCPAVGPQLEAVFRHMLAKKPADRQQSMAEVIADLDACLGELSPEDAAAAVAGRGGAEGLDVTLNQFRKSHATVVERPTATDVQPQAQSAAALPRRKLPVALAAFGLALAGLAAAAVVLNRQGGGPAAAVASDDSQVHLNINQPGATVSLDGQPVALAIGITDADEQHRCVPVKIGKKYRLKVSKAGFEEFVQDVVAGKEHPHFEVALKPVAGPISTPPAPVKTVLLRWIIANGGSATLAVGSAAQTMECARAQEIPSGPFAIKAVRLDGATSLKEDELAKLAVAEGLQSLSLKGAAVGDRAAEEIAKLKQLWSVDLSQTKITDLGLGELATLPELRDLNLQKTTVGDEGLAALAKLPELENLVLTDTQVGDRGLLQLVGLENLRTIALNGTRVTVAGVEGLKAARPKLNVTWDAPDLERELARKLLNTGAALALVSPEGKPLGAVRKAADLPVERFQISGVDWSGRVQITDADLPPLAALPKLRAINLDGTSVTGEGLAKLSLFKGLRSIELGSLQIPDRAVDDLKKALHESDVRWTPNSERLVAQWVVARKGIVNVATPDGEVITGIDNAARLPAGRFTITAFKLDNDTQLADEDLRRFKGFTRLETVSLNNTPIGDAALAFLAACPALRDLSLNNTRVTDAGLAAVGHLPSLRLLVVGGTAITDRGLEQLNNVKQLTDLSLSRTKISDDGLLQLARFTSLNRLSLADTPLTDAALPQLSKLASVSQLFLSGTQISDAGLEELAVSLPKCKIQGNPPDPQRLALRWILSQGGLAATTHGDVRKLAELPRGACELTKIDLGDLPKVTGEMLIKISPCTAITELDLSGTSVNDEGLKLLAPCTALERLSLAETRITDQGLVHLKAMTRLKWLDLHGTRISGAELAQLSGLTELTTLSLDGARLSDRTAAALNKFANLTYLNLSNNATLGDKGIAALVDLTKLQTLGLAGTAVGDASLSTVAKFSELQNLDLSSTAVTDAGLPQLKVLANLKTVRLYGTAAGDPTLTVLAGLKNLRSLNVAKTKATEAGIATLKAALPDVKISKSEARADPDNPPSDNGGNAPRGLGLRDPR